ncbi:uncharacterized protein LOC127702663 [Mytilus californianus]|uniref:uncharacterized protein LOC127702663 n=1 Tax=Mytilus californianus TaxID=6549 RepID=UPI0022457B77|nr:uncharacterized protein LOC127702663 [Mytilus californianus]
MDPSQAEQQEEVQPPEGDVPEELIENPSNTTHLDENPETRRVRDLTEKGKGAFTEKRDKFCQELEALWSDVESQLSEVTTPPNKIQQILTAQDNLVKACTNYRRLTDEYLDFLKRTRTLDSQKDIDACNLTLDIRLSKVDHALETLHEHRLDLTKAKSTKTKTSKSKKTSHSGSSNVSDMSSLARRKRAKAEAAKSKIAFVEQHALILQQEAMLEEQALFRQTEMEQGAARKKAEMEQEATRKKAEMEHEAEQEAIRRKAQIKQEAARVSREKTELKAKLNLLEAQKEAAAAEAEARILEYDDSQALDDLPKETEDPLQRVQDFVNKHPEPTAIQEATAPQQKKQTSVKYELSHEAPDFVPSVALNLPSQTPAVSPTHAKSPEVNVFPDLGTITGIGKQGVSEQIPVAYQKLGVSEEILAEHQKQGVAEEIPVAHQQQINPTSEITRFLLRKDLLFSRLTSFNDRAESFHTWKASFKNVTDELQVSDSEQIDLLIKWLGPESAKHAISIRASNANNPTKGIQRLWKRLDERYGAPEMLEASLTSKLAKFPTLTNKDNARLYELSDILSEIEYHKENPKLGCLLAYFDSPSGINPVIEKLPYGLQEKWITRASRYKSNHGVAFPPFTELSAFISEISRIKNDPGFIFGSKVTPNTKGAAPRFTSYPKTKVGTHKTAVEQQSGDASKQGLCILHNTKHSLNECRAFRAKSIEERKGLLKQNNVCYKCCDSTTHRSRECNARISCKECGSKQHTTALHITKPQQPASSHSSPPKQAYGGEPTESAETKSTSVNSTCTEICKDIYSGKSCAKILPVNVYYKDNQDKVIRMYAIIDDQSNRSLASPEFFNLFDVRDKPENYTLSTCSGRVVTSGKRGRGFVMESINGNDKFDLPVLIECDHIPNNRDEIPTPEVAMHHPHLKELRGSIPPIEENCQILLLIGRDLIEAHHVLDQRIGPPRTPYAQQLKLGWVVIGETCINKQHVPLELNVKITNILPTGQPSTFQPCTSKFDIRENYTDPVKKDLQSPLFEKTRDDDKPGMSFEDKMFMKQMDNEFVRDSEGSWVAPLPFRVPRQSLPSNRQQALHRANMLDASLNRNLVKREHFLTFMSKILDNNHAELAPPLDEHEECWYLPLFGVYHPKKPDQIRGVFDSSAKCNGVSLNSVLLTGPDLTNDLLGVLLRFRKEMVAVTADVQHMFHCFVVRKDHRNYLRFLWHKNNDLQENLVEFRMRVHVFGNSPSPAVATLGLRKAAQASEQEFGSHVTSFVTRDFYVDDGLTSCPTKEEAVKLMKDTQQALAKYGNLRLHKFASNCAEVISAFHASDLASNLKDLDLESDSKPLQRSLGLSWDVNTDNFLFQLSSENKPITRRGILSTINSLYDPLGFLAPVIIQGKLLLRKIVSETVDWDQPLSDERAAEWKSWRDTLIAIETLRIPRTYVPYLSKTATKELHVFSDASEKAIAAVAYLRTTDSSDEPNIGFILGKAKVAPTSGHTIPRLELSAAVLAVEITQTVMDNLDLHIDTVKFYTDSKVVLGYISNETRRFFIYVANRVEKIRKFSSPSQWNYVPTNRNPADSGTRSVPAHEIHSSEWLLGPKQLLSSEQKNSEDIYQLIDPEEDGEIRATVNVAKTFATSEHKGIGTDRFNRFSNWTSLVRAIAFLERFSRLHGSKQASSVTSFDSFSNAENFILISAQHEVYGDEIDCIKRQEQINKRSPIANLNPFLDEKGLLRVGGRIVKSDLNFREKKPLIVPGRHHIATLLVRHYHDKIKHQGRHFTDGAIRSAGFWIVGAKRLISSIIHKCVTCRKLRGKTEYQIMSDLPEDRLEPSPPFTNVGIDTFGPWTIVSRKTRGGYANSKRWAILFTCLVTRAIHIELIEEMSSSAFINAVRRFAAIRGQVKIFRSDRGTNFIGAIDDLKIDSINVEDGPFKNFLYNSGTTWIFNPPHSSHMGGAWERMIGIARRILDSMLLNAAGRSLTHDVLNTLMAEVSAIVNSRPLVPVSTDPENPLILTPAMLLTQKTDYIFTSDQLGEFDRQDLCLAEWRRVQALASVFWSRWRKEYLPLLQPRRKWTDDRRDLIKGDVILLKDKNLCRTQWPIGVIVNSFKSSDEHVRKAEVRIIVNGKATIYTRPIVDMILLIENDCI